MTKMTLQERFDEKFTRGAPDECWVWTAAVGSDGYGRIRVGSRTDGTKRMVRAHRVSYELHKGPIPCGLHVLHRCDNPPCVNPEHLWLGTRLDNMADMVAKGRARNGVLRGEAHPSVKLTDAQVAEIRVIGSSMPRREIAARFGVGQPLISMIINNQRRRAA